MPTALMVHAVASILIGRPEQGAEGSRQSRDRQRTTIRSCGRRLAFARQDKWADAREKFKNVEFAITSLPIELQRIVISDAMRASLEVRDYSGAAKRAQRSARWSAFPPR